jgi:hypothetical protein
MDDRPWRRALLVGLGVFAAGKAGLAAASAFAWIGTVRPGQSFSSVLKLWASQYDSNWFIAISQHGYYAEPDAAPAAFFPLYPLLIRIFTPLCLGNAWVAALVVANLALLGALVVLFRLTEHEFDRAPAGRTIFYLVAFPTGFFLTAAYNEGLFIALTVAALYCLRREHWWWAGVAGALATATRSAGILVLGAFVYEYVRKHGRSVRLDALAVLIIPLGLVAVMIVDQIAYGDALAFSHTQAKHWGRELDWPGAAVLDAFNALHQGVHLRGVFGEVWVHNALELGIVVLLAVLLVLMFVGPWKVRRDQLVLPLFGVALWLFMVSFPSRYTDDIPYPLLSASRIGLEVFPAFMLLGRLGERPVVDRTVLAVFLMLQGILVARFLHSGWVA